MTRRLRRVRVLLDVSAVPARPAGAGMYTVALASGLSRRPDVELHVLTRRNDVARWSSLTPTATVHGAAYHMSPYLRISTATADDDLLEGLRRIQTFCEGLH